MQRSMYQPLDGGMHSWWEGLDGTICQCGAEYTRAKGRFRLQACCMQGENSLREALCLG